MTISEFFNGFNSLSSFVETFGTTGILFLGLGITTLFVVVIIKWVFLVNDTVQEGAKFFTGRDWDNE